MQNDDFRSSRRATLIGIAGCTNSGKSTLAKMLSEEIEKRNCSVKIIGQDNYYLEKEKVRTIKNINDPNITFYDYDSVDALDVEKMLADIKFAFDKFDFIIVEGSMITEITSIYNCITTTVFLTIDKELCIKRRVTRNYDPPDEPGFFDQVVWPSYERTLSNAQQLDRLSFLDTSTIPNIRIIQEKMKECLYNLLRIQTDAISIEQIIKFTNDDSCGAISSFIGTTRDIFEEKTVVRLEYECYESMAYVELRKLCVMARKTFSSLCRIAIVHRIGEVKVSEASIIIVTSSPQRKDAIAATEYLINQVKKSVPIWKKEVYSDGTCSWKANQESIKNNSN